MLLLPVALALCGIVPESFAQTQPSAAPTPKAMLVDGQPALGLDYGDGMGFLMVYTEFHDKPAFRLSVAMEYEKFTSHTCGGYLWVTSGAVSYSPEPSADQKVCTPETSTSPTDIGKYHFFIFVYSGNARENMQRWSHSDSLQAEATSADRIARGWLELAYKNFPTAEKKFADATSHIPVPMSNEESAALSSSERTAEGLYQSGNIRAAFDTYVAALNGLRPNATGKDLDAARQSLLSLASKLNPHPTIPDEAQRYFFGSQAALQEWKDKGDPAKLDVAIEQLNEALRIAPWWPEAYFNRGLVLEDRGRYAEAVDSLKLYLLAAPNASDATQVKQKIYMLEYKAGAR